MRLARAAGQLISNTSGEPLIPPLARRSLPDERPLPPERAFVFNR